MLFYWVILGIRRVQWLFHIPAPEELAYINAHARCPVCGKPRGRLRCVLKIKPGPQSKAVAPTTFVSCQHTCKRCGARWFDPPVSKHATPSTVLPAVPRTEIEQREDRSALLQQAEK